MVEPETRFMLQALEAAELGRGSVEPNPMVGCVVVRDGVVVATGWHQRFGGPHAEIVALDAAGDRSQGGDLYVTLEPCCHFGKTPPCVDRIIRAGIRRVFAAMLDPNPLVSGQGVHQLQAAGIAVTVGVCGDQAKELNAPFVKLMTRKKPFVHAKWAMTLDGKIAAAGGESKWITGEEARAHSSRFRGLMDGVLVGIGTVLADDPMLNARPTGPRTPVRIVLDSEARLPLDSRLALTAREIPTWVATTRGASEQRIERLRESGCEVLQCDPTPRGRIDIACLLDELGRRSMTHLLVEGGGSVLGSLFDADLADAIRVYVSTSVIGGETAPVAVGGFGRSKLSERFSVRRWKSERLGDDLFIEGCR